MTEPLFDKLALSAFKFQPSTPEPSGRAFSLTFRILAMTMLVMSLVWMLKLWFLGDLGAQETTPASAKVWFGAAWGLMAYTCWHIWTSRTCLKDQTLAQSWIWNKQVAISELAFCKLIRIKGLEAVLAPRLYARTLNGKITVLYTADPLVLKDFERLCQELTQFRNELLQA